jgi:hypothetical protein
VKPNYNEHAYLIVDFSSVFFISHIPLICVQLEGAKLRLISIE